MINIPAEHNIRSKCQINIMNHFPLTQSFLFAAHREWDHAWVDGFFGKRGGEEERGVCKYFLMPDMS